MHSVNHLNGTYDILLVEDNAAHARLVFETLRRTDCARSNIDHVTSLSEAIDQVKVSAYDLVLLDLGLPESTGLDTFLKFHNEFPSQPVVVLTSINDDEIALRAVKAGAEDYLPKDAMAHSLSRTVRHAVERARLNSSLHEREMQVSTLLSKNLDGLAVLDGNGKLQYANAAAMEILNVYSSDHLLSHIRTVDNPGEPTAITFVTDGGSTLVVEVKATDITWDQRVAHLFSLRDITLRRQLESNLQQSQKLKLIGTLAGGITHDFNNILTVISGHAQLIALKEENNSEIREDLGCILDAVQWGNHLIRDLLHLGRPRDLEKRKISLNELLKKTEKLVGATIRKTHEMHFVVAEEECPVLASPESLKQAIINLIMNSRDATEGGGQLRISLSRVLVAKSFQTVFDTAPAGIYQRITISDNGSGMTETTREKIFEPFFTTKDREDGTGLGMFIVSGVIQQHNGYIICESTPGEGTTFELYLPSADEDCKEERKVSGF